MAFPFFKETGQDIEDIGRRRLFVYFLLLLIFPLLIFGSILITRGFFLLAGINFTVIGVFIGFIWVLKHLKNAKILFRICLSMLILLCIYWVNRGAIKGYASIWVLTIPPFAFYLMGRKEGMAWTLLISVTTAVQFLVPSLSLYHFVYDPSFVSRHLFAFFLIIFFTYNYESMREHYKKAMENEQLKLVDETTRLEDAKKELENLNQMLNLEMTNRLKIEEELRNQRERLEETVVERTAELRKANEELEVSEARYRVLADTITDMIWSMDMDLRFTYVSPSVSRLLGYSVDEMMVIPLDQVDPPDSLQKVFSAFAEEIELEKGGDADPNRYKTLALEHIRKDGVVIPVELTVSFLRNQNGVAIGIVGITRDISERIKAQEERLRMQEQLAQAQKMEAIGTLVGGIAHDFNNILGGIIGSLELLSSRLEDETLKERDPINQYIRLGMDSALRSSRLIKQLLTLSRKHEISLSPLEMNDSLTHVLNICRNSLPKSVEIDVILSSEPLVVIGDMVQIEQVLLNLCINATHSMTIMRPEGSRQGGVLKIRSSRIHSDHVMNELYPDTAISDSDWVRIEVSDTGIGMNEETRLKIFEPFFTTKQKEKGSGLGLAISYNIIRQHRGIIHVYSEPGKGSCFFVYLPAYSNVGEADLRQKTAGAIVSGSGTILVIDDETVMCQVAKGILEKCGYQVVTAESGDEGIRIYRERSDEISAVLLDLSMPGKSGLEVFEELAAVNRDVRVVLASGMLDASSLEAAERIGIRKTVQKPYLVHELSTVIRSVMDP